MSRKYHVNSIVVNFKQITKYEEILAQILLNIGINKPNPECYQEYLQIV